MLSWKKSWKERKMVKKLEDYLAEISRYLAVWDEAGEILTEIRSHILEKTEAEFGNLDEDNLGKTISNYGSPRKVAEKYLEGNQIISPSLKGHLFLYTWILFAFHFGMILVGLIFKTSLLVFPFLYIPSMSVVQAVFYLPMAFLFNFGLVTFFLYFLTQKKKDLRLPWPARFKPHFWGYVPPAPKIIWLVVMLVGFGALLIFFLKFKTLFLLSASLSNPESILNPSSSLYYSIILLAVFAVGIIGYISRFWYNTEKVNLVTNGMAVILFWIAWNNPLEIVFMEIPGLNIKLMATVVLALLTLWAVIAFLRSLFLILRNSLFIKNVE